MSFVRRAKSFRLRRLMRAGVQEEEEVVPVPPATADRAEVVARLLARFGDRASAVADIRRQHANSLTWIRNEPADVVVWPNGTGEVAEIVRLASATGTPVVAYGAGTSLEGHVNAPSGGICIDLSRMDRVLAVDTGDLDVTVEAGISRGALARHLRDTGLFFPVDPGAEEATIGGMAATRASGTTTVRYGAMRDNVLSVVAVMANGEIVRTGRRARKSAAGYDLTRLLIGSEGTLGIMTELTLRLYGVPETILAAVCPFDTVAAAAHATMEAVAQGLGLARIELLDATSMRIVCDYARLDLAPLPTLFVEVHGTPAAAREQVQRFEEIARAAGASAFQWAEGEDERRRLWKARHNAYWAVRATYAGKDVLATDVCVPISRLAQCIAETEADAREAGLVAPILGHVGDGNFHATPVITPGDERERRALEGFLKRLAERAIAFDGTCTGEHGVGQGKARYLQAELGAGVEVMRAIKLALDPKGILNPGKIFAAAAPDRAAVRATY
jgi:D-lactate dehydrogenase (cytochrome)